MRHVLSAEALANRRLSGLTAMHVIENPWASLILARVYRQCEFWNNSLYSYTTYFE